MADPSAVLKELLERHPSAPFLFVGSGFSRRYLGLEDWAGLLARFCGPIREFGYYSSKADGDLPRAASFMAEDYNEWWWGAADTASSRAAHGARVKSKSDALKVDIARYISTLSVETARNSEFGDEIGSFSKIAVDGIITTNWDFLIEELFPDFRVFVGQQELLFSNPQSIGEIYKIHGSVSDPESLVLTAEDYQEFSSKNPYLAAKLVTIFVEHPIIFLGYSITDPHIRAIISSIAACLPQEKVAAFQENLVFVQRTGTDEQPSIERTTIQSDAFSVTMMVAKVAHFGQVYEALTTTKRKIPARVLRFFKEQLYELVHVPSANANKLAVVDFDEINSAENVEFVVGIGVAQRLQEHDEKADQHVQDALSKKGYAGVTSNEIFSDCLAENSRFNASDLLSAAFPSLARSNRTFIPVYRYLRAARIDSEDALKSSSFEGAKKVVARMAGADYSIGRTYLGRYRNAFTGLSTEEIIDKATSPIEAGLMLGFQPSEEVDVERLRAFLLEQAGAFTIAPYDTAYRKLICRYDRLKFGF
ncbi:SIR2 family protein [Phenylobacterium sp.]|uniref:SIR2 family protein n=1 Tax=Phenylobacterium sp. TaxID=1871053 RepID=UPI00301DE1D1